MFVKGKGLYWEKKMTKKGERKKRKEWRLAPYSQNLISALFYLRTFTMRPGKVITIPVADAGKPVLIKGHVLRKERITVPAGEFDTHVVKIKYEVDGAFKQIGDIFYYITDDDRRWLVKFEAKIKVGTINAEARVARIPE